MNNLLKAMGFWIWGLIAIGLSVSMVSVSYRLLALYRAHESHAHPASSPTLDSSPTLTGLPRSENKPAEAIIDTQGIKAGQPMISRVVEVEMRSAQSAIQDKQWSEALKNLDAAAA